MKHWDSWLIVGLAVLLISMAFLMHGYIGASSSRVLAPLDNLSQALAREDWREARALFAQSKEEWQRVKRVWPMLINHNELREVDRSFSQMQVLLEQEDKKQAEREVADLSYYLRHVPADERVTWQNIL